MATIEADRLRALAPGDLDDCAGMDADDRGSDTGGVPTTRDRAGTSPAADSFVVPRPQAIAVLLAIALSFATACSDAAGNGVRMMSATAAPVTGTPCSIAWYRTIEEAVPTGDGQGHGPDLGSTEWKSVVEFKLGIRGQPDVPDRGSQAWCHHIDRIVLSGTAPASVNEDTPAEARNGAQATGPSFSCTEVAAGSIEATICQDEQLSALDRRLAAVHEAARRKATNERPPLLAAEQRGWLKGRDECWKSQDPHACVVSAYVHRIAELEARYRLVPDSGPVRFVCDGNPASEVVATFFATDPPTLIAERGDSTSLMYLAPSASGTRYQGRNESFWEHHGEALITWGYGAPEMRCTKVSAGEEEPELVPR